MCTRTILVTSIPMLLLPDILLKFANPKVAFTSRMRWAAVRARMRVEYQGFSRSLIALIGVTREVARDSIIDSLSYIAVVSLPKTST